MHTAAHKHPLCYIGVILKTLVTLLRMRIQCSHECVAAYMKFGRDTFYAVSAIINDAAYEPVSNLS